MTSLIQDQVSTTLGSNSTPKKCSKAKPLEQNQKALWPKQTLVFFIKLTENQQVQQIRADSSPKKLKITNHVTPLVVPIVQEQASMTLEEITSLIQDQVSTTIGSNSTPKKCSKAKLLEETRKLSGQSIHLCSSSTINNHSKYVPIYPQQSRRSPTTWHYLWSRLFKNKLKLKKSQIRFKIKCAPPLNQIRLQKALWPKQTLVFFIKLVENQQAQQARVDSSTTKDEDHQPRETPCGHVSFKTKPWRSLKKLPAKFKTKPIWSLKKLQAQFNIKPWLPLNRHLCWRISKHSCQIHSLCEGLQNTSSTCDKHMHTTRLEVGAFVDIKIFVK